MSYWRFSILKTPCTPPQSGPYGSFRDDDIRFVLPATAFAEVLVGTARQDATDLADRRRQVIAAFGTPHAQSVVTGDRKWRGIQPNVKVVGR